MECQLGLETNTAISLDPICSTGSPPPLIHKNKNNTATTTAICPCSEKLRQRLQLRSRPRAKSPSREKKSRTRKCEACIKLTLEYGPSSRSGRKRGFRREGQLQGICSCESRWLARPACLALWNLAVPSCHEAAPSPPDFHATRRCAQPDEIQRQRLRWNKVRLPARVVRIGRVTKGVVISAFQPLIPKPAGIV